VLLALPLLVVAVVIIARLILGWAFR